MSKRFQGGILGAGFDPLKAPNAPTGVTAAKGNQSATVSFTAPTNVGGSAVTGYAVLSNPGGFGASGASSPVTVSGLTNGTPYTFTVTALNSYGPSPAGGPSGSVTPSESYWIGLLGGSAVDYGYSIAVDSSGNAYVCGYSNASGTTDFQIAKYNTSGAIQWQRRLGGSGTGVGNDIAVDSSGNVYVCGYSNTGNANDIQIAKYNTSGTLQWQRKLDGGSTTEVGEGIAVDSSGNVYVCGWSSATGGAYIQIIKYDTSGTLQWQRQLGDGDQEYGYAIAVDNSGNVYVCGRTDNTFTISIQIAKYNTSGTLQWQRTLDSSDNDYGYDIAVDSSGNVYVSGQSGGLPTASIPVAKYNTSGALQWQRKLSSGSSFNDGQSISVDSSGNVYVCGQSNASGNADMQIAKYNTSGTIQWQRRLGSSATDVGQSIAVDSSGNVYVCGRSNASGTYDFLIAKLPGDGSLTGTYTVGGYSFTYEASTLTDAVGGMTDAASSLSSSTSSLTSATSTLTDAATTLTSSVTLI